MNNKNKNNNNNNKGFTLVEMVIAITILGLLIAGATKTFNVYYNKGKAELNQERLQNAILALEEFKAARGFYPCPASLTAPYGNADYGFSTTCEVLNTQNAVAPDTAINTCDNGVCVLEGVDNEGNTLNKPDSNPRRVRVGALPFREMNINEHETYDSYGSRIVYAVEESLTNLYDFNLNTGGIQLVDTANRSLLDVSNRSAQKIIFSLGKDRTGGYTSQGSNYNIAPCNENANSENNNCRFLNVASNDVKAVFLHNEIGGAEGQSVNDDNIALNFTFTQEGVNVGWRMGSPKNILQQYHENGDPVLNASGEQISITEQQATRAITPLVTDTNGNPVHEVISQQNLFIDKTLVLGKTNLTNPTTDPADNVSAAFDTTQQGLIVLDNTTQRGDLIAKQQLSAPQFCDPETGDCFTVSEILRTCPDGTYVSGIGNGDPSEYDAINNGTSKVWCHPIYYGCQAGQALVGKNADNSPRCSNIISLIGSSTSGSDGGSSSSGSSDGGSSDGGSSGVGNSDGGSSDGGSSDGGSSDGGSSDGGSSDGGSSDGGSSDGGSSDGGSSDGGSSDGGSSDGGSSSSGSSDGGSSDGGSSDGGSSDGGSSDGGSSDGGSSDGGSSDGGSSDGGSSDGGSSDGGSSDGGSSDGGSSDGGSSDGGSSDGGSSDGGSSDGGSSNGGLEEGSSGGGSSNGGSGDGWSQQCGGTTPIELGRDPITGVPNCGTECSAYFACRSGASTNTPGYNNLNCDTSPPAGCGGESLPFGICSDGQVFSMYYMSCVPVCEDDASLTRGDSGTVYCQAH